MNEIARIRPLKYRTICISDIHLGSRCCKAAFLLDFLKSTQCEQLYLIGDVIDLWSMQRSMYWPQAHNDVVRVILGKASRGTRVTYLAGNHDTQLRDFVGIIFNNVAIENETVYTTADGRRLLLLHGDQFDSIIRCSRLSNLIGHYAYDALLHLHRQVDRVRRKFGFPYWSLATYLKTRVKNARGHIDRFASAAAHEARRRGFDGVVCGHIHHADLREIDGVLYCNDGDWVENCTALTETHDGSLQVLHWSDQTHSIKWQLAPNGPSLGKVA